jgi:hypothetical protein
MSPKPAPLPTDLQRRDHRGDPGDCPAGGNSRPGRATAAGRRRPASRGQRGEVAGAGDLADASRQPPLRLDVGRHQAGVVLLLDVDREGIAEAPRKPGHDRQRCLAHGRMLSDSAPRRSRPGSRRRASAAGCSSKVLEQRSSRAALLGLLRAVLPSKQAGCSGALQRSEQGVGCVFRRKWTAVPIQSGQQSERSDAQVILS